MRLLLRLTTRGRLFKESPTAKDAAPVPEDKDPRELNKDLRAENEDLRERLAAAEARTTQHTCGRQAVAQENARSREI